MPGSRQLVPRRGLHAPHRLTTRGESAHDQRAIRGSIHRDNGCGADHHVPGRHGRDRYLSDKESQVAGRADATPCTTGHWSKRPSIPAAPGRGSVGMVTARPRTRRSRRVGAPLRKTSVVDADHVLGPLAGREVPALIEAHKPVVAICGANYEERGPFLADGELLVGSWIWRLHS